MWIRLRSLAKCRTILWLHWTGRADISHNFLTIYSNHKIAKIKLEFQMRQYHVDRLNYRNSVMCVKLFPTFSALSSSLCQLSDCCVRMENIKWNGQMTLNPHRSFWFRSCRCRYVYFMNAIKCIFLSIERTGKKSVDMNSCGDIDSVWHSTCDAVYEFFSIFRHWTVKKNVSRIQLNFCLFLSLKINSFDDSVDLWNAYRTIRI